MSRPPQERPLRVALFVPALLAAGAERVVVDTALRLDRARFEVAVITMTPGGALDAEIERAPDITLHTLGFRGGRPRDLLSSGPTPMWRLRKLLQRERFDLVHSHLFQANVASLLLRSSISKLVVTEHTVLSDYTPARFATRYRLLRGLYARADRIAFVCDAGARSFRERCGFRTDKLAVIRNGAVLDRFLAAQPSQTLRRELCPRAHATVFVTVARMSHAKSLETLPLLARRLVDAGHDVQFVLAGGASVGERLRLDDHIREHRVQDHVTLLGQRDDIAEILACSDVFLLTSRYEGLPISVIEAMAAGLPVVATDVGGMSEVVAHDRTGLLSAFGDLATMESHARALITSPARASAMGAAGRARAQRDFSADAMARRSAELYRELCGV